MMNIKKLFGVVVILGMSGGLVFAISEQTTGTLDNSISPGLTIGLTCNPSSVSNGSVNATTCVITCNTNYDKSGTSCVLRPSGGGGGGGGSSSYTAPTCALSDLICTSGTYIAKAGISCVGGQLSTSCTLSTGSVYSGSVYSGAGSARYTGSIVGSPFSTEFNKAYQFASEHGITTMHTIQDANMTGLLIRAHMAKMMVNYAIEVLGKTVDTTKACVFTDMAGQSDEMKGYAIQACQLGIMGINRDTFAPDSIVIRAELGTVLSRMLYDTPESGTPYYLVHLNLLKEKGIITNTNPNLTETRAYVMLMLMRAAQ